MIVIKKDYLILKIMNLENVYGYLIVLVPKYSGKCHRHYMTTAYNILLPWSKVTLLMNQQGFVTIIVSVKAFIQKSRLESVQEELIKGAGPLSQDTTTE